MNDLGIIVRDFTERCCVIKPEGKGEQARRGSQRAEIEEIAIKQNFMIQPVVIKLLDKRNGIFPFKVQPFR